ncbi:MAG: hypothetical protein FWD16_03110, partial [Clostridia bacterium]|nr:hypothetical protein [Clostridia bacterium]
NLPANNLNLNNNGTRPPVNNTAIDGSADSRKKIIFENRSEVTVRYKLEFDISSLFTGGASSVIGVVNVWGFNSAGNTLHGGYRGYMGGTATSVTDLGTIGTATSGFVTLTPPANSGWTILAPGASETLLLEFCWEFSQGYVEQPTGSGLTPVATHDVWDYPDTALGLAAAKGDIFIEPKFKLTVEQVD